MFQIIKCRFRWKHIQLILYMLFLEYSNVGSWLVISVGGIPPHTIFKIIFKYIYIYRYMINNINFIIWHNSIYLYFLYIFLYNIIPFIFIYIYIFLIYFIYIYFKYMSTCQNSLAQSLDKRGDISVLIEDLHITYEAGPKLNEAKLQGSASSALGNIQYTYVRLFTASPHTNTTRTQQPGPAALIRTTSSTTCILLVWHDSVGSVLRARFAR